MESANLSQADYGNLFSKDKDAILVRPAASDDIELINHLATHATFRHRHADWFSLEDWLSEPVFLMGHHPSGNLGGLAITADPMPAAWVRFLAVERTGLRKEESRELVHALFETALAQLSEIGVTEIGWMTKMRWSDTLIEALGFDRMSTMITFGKESFDLPESIQQRSDVTIRPAFPEDMRVLAKIEAETYGPLWRQSARGLHFGWRAASSFDLALLDGEIVGFQHSTQHETTAHLARLTVSPEHQGKGIGSTLLAHALRGYRRAGVRSMTLNTQVENLGAQNLYRRFGYEPTGFNLPLWGKEI